MSFEETLKGLNIPDGTLIEEGLISTSTGLVIHSRSKIESSLKAASLIGGENIKVIGDLMIEGDLVLDLWAEIVGDVTVKRNAHVTEFVKIFGKLLVEGDLNLGGNVSISNGFEAKGFVEISDPISFFVEMTIDISKKVLNRGHESEEIGKYYQELAESEIGDAPDIFVMPDATSITLDRISSSTHCIIGSNCRIFKDINCAGLMIGSGTKIKGDLESRVDVEVDDGVSIDGSIISGGRIVINRGVIITGGILATSLELHETARVMGDIVVRERMKFLRDDE